MFAEFLHPELVLFGEFLNPKKSVKHNAQLKDGQIIIHQQINRISSDPQKQKQIRKLEELIYQQQQQQYNQQEQRNYHRQLHEQQLYKLNQYKNEQESDDDYEDDSDEGPNPYDQEYYGFNIQRQYSPEQLARVLANGSLDNSPVKITQVPFSKQSPKRKPENKEEVPQGDENQDDGWQTEQQEENYVINEMLEEAGGNFAMQL